MYNVPIKDFHGHIYSRNWDDPKVFGMLTFSICFLGIFDQETFIIQIVALFTYLSTFIVYMLPMQKMSYSHHFR